MVANNIMGCRLVALIDIGGNPRILRPAAGGVQVPNENKNAGKYLDYAKASNLKVTSLGKASRLKVDNLDP